MELVFQENAWIDRPPDQSDIKEGGPFYLVNVNSNTREIKVDLYFKANQPYPFSSKCG